MKKTVSKKKTVQQELFDICKSKGNMTFDNKLVKKVADKHNFSNKYDVTKINDSSVLAPGILEQGYCIVHLGKGRHRFVEAADKWFHKFEPISSEEVIWPYRKSVLNETDTSESNILSVGFNQRIIHDFLYEDIVASPKMYGARRTKFTGSYLIDGEPLECTELQMEIDLTTEYLGEVTIFEGKNKFPNDFAIYQLFHPFIRFRQLREDKHLNVSEINCCYLCRNKKKNDSVIRLYLYTFENSQDISSLKLVKNAQYRLLKR